MFSIEKSQSSLSTLCINSLNEMEFERTVAFIREHIAETEGYEIDFRLLGDIIHALGAALSFKVDKELLTPISGWQCDDVWLQRFNEEENQEYDWAFYKQRQRRWTKQQKRLAAERLNRYRQEITRNRRFRADVKQITGRSNQKKGADLALNGEFVDAIVSPFSPVAQDRREVDRQFCQVVALSAADLLPWKLLIRAEVIGAGRVNMNDMRTYCPENKKHDKVSKLLHLLELEKNGEVQLVQEEPFGEILVVSNESEIDGSIAVIDRDGRNFRFDWLELNHRQRSKIIDDVKQHKILFKAFESK